MGQWVGRRPLGEWRGCSPLSQRGVGGLGVDLWCAVACYGAVCSRGRRYMHAEDGGEGCVREEVFTHQPAAGPLVGHVCLTTVFGSSPPLA